MSSLSARACGSVARAAASAAAKQACVAPARHLGTVCLAVSRCAPPRPAGVAGGLQFLEQRRPISREAYKELHRRSVEDPEGFWGEAAKDIVWSKPYDKVLSKLKEPFYTWYPGGELNMCYNAVDRHVDEGHGSRDALIYDSPVTGQLRTYSYAELQAEVAKMAGVLSAQGVAKGDRVVIYMPMIPEAVFAMLACARLGAPHSVVFGGFPDKELAVRIDDAKPKVILTASCGVEPARTVAYKPMLDGALAIAKHKPDRCIVKQRPQLRAELGPLDLDWDEAVVSAAPCKECVPVASSDPLYILYTSGTTGRPKGVVRDTGGCAVTLKWSMGAFMNTHPGETYWAASDIGWVVGHSYIVYAPLLQGCATVLFEGKPVGTPDAGTFWRVIQQHKVRGFFVAPTGLRAVRKEDPHLELIGKYDISTLRSLFVAGERCDPETSRTFAEALGVAVFDNWWQTETGSPICGFQDDAIGRKDGSTSLPMPGYQICAMGPDGQPLSEPGAPGPLAAKLPLPPGTFPTLWNDDEGYVKGYMSFYDGYYSSGDAGFVDEDGYVTVLERTDDVINVAAHRISCGSVEASVKAHPDVNDCAVVGAADPVKGQVPVVLVVLMDGVTRSAEDVAADLRQKVRDDVGPIATPAAIGVVEALPKTRSGKVLRKNIRGLADGKPVPVPGTIENPAAMDVVAAKISQMGLPRQ